MIDLDSHECKQCKIRIPINREYCHICDAILNGDKSKYPRDLRELLDNFIEDVAKHDHEMHTDALAVLNALETYTYNKKYKVTIQ